MIDLDAIKPSTMDFQLDGETYSVPTLDTLDAENVLDLLNKETVSRTDILAMFREVIQKHAPNALGHMTLAQLKALLDAWESTGSAGESSPSSD